MPLSDIKGFTGEADILRRAMGKKKKAEFDEQGLLMVL